MNKKYKKLILWIAIIISWRILVNIIDNEVLSKALVPVLLLSILIFFTLIYPKIKMSSDAKAMGANKSLTATHMHGIDFLDSQSKVSLFFTDEKLVIESGGKSIVLKYEQITAIEPIRHSDLITKDKSVIGRGVVGGVLLGPIGALVGGMSGIGKKKQYGDFLFINYQSSINDEIKVLIFNTNKFNKARELSSYVKTVHPKLSISRDINL